MTAPIPREARRIACELYLAGKTLDLIADLTGISKTSVFNIARGLDGHDPDYVLMRTLAVNLRKNGSDLSQYATVIRISSLLDEHGVDYATAEDLLQKFIPMCYKLHWEPASVVLALHKFLHSAERFGHTAMEHAIYFNKLHASEANLHVRNYKKRKELRDLIQKCDFAKDNLDVFLSEDGFESLITMNKIRIIELESEIKALKKDALLSQQHDSIDPPEISKLNESLIIPVSEQEVMNKLEDIRRHPSMYPYLFDKDIPTGPNSIAGASEANATGIELEDPQNLNQKEVSIDQN
jgi:hypothetical protein